MLCSTELLLHRFFQPPILVPALDSPDARYLADFGIAVPVQGFDELVKQADFIRLAFTPGYCFEKMLARRQRILSSGSPAAIEGNRDIERKPGTSTWRTGRARRTIARAGRRSPGRDRRDFGNTSCKLCRGSSCGPRQESETSIAIPRLPFILLFARATEKSQRLSRPEMTGHMSGICGLSLSCVLRNRSKRG
jgi:hypothetical protein